MQPTAEALARFAEQIAAGLMQRLPEAKRGMQPTA